jgi:hypothetical protein
VLWERGWITGVDPRRIVSVATGTRDHDPMAPFASFRYHALTTSSFPASLPFSTQQKHKAGRSDSIRSKGLTKDHEFNVRWLREARRVLKADGTLWVTGTHHIIFSIGFALQKLGYRIINAIL